jgi:3-hydroxyisobutyrate dehydrogenase
MAKIGFLGLGVMGAPMAGHLATAGHQVVVYNRTGAKAQAWVAQHGGGYSGGGIRWRGFRHGLRRQ